MIPLEDFIDQALASIVKGIQKAQKSDVGDHIAPFIQGEGRNDRGIFNLKSDTTMQATIVEFDLQVTTETTCEGAGSATAGFKLYVVDVKLGGDGTLSTKAANHHRLRFAIPIKIPVGVRACDAAASATRSSSLPTDS